MQAKFYAPGKNLFAGQGGAAEPVALAVKNAFCAVLRKLDPAVTGRTGSRSETKHPDGWKALAKERENE